MDWLTTANQAFARKHPGDSGIRQPVHTVYGGAQLFKYNVTRRIGSLAERSLLDYAPDAATLALALGVPNRLAETVYGRVIEKLRREPVEAFHLDFEDGYGIRSDEEEDAAALHAAAQVAQGFAESTLPAFTGIRIKPLDEESKVRGLRTLNLFLSHLLEKTGGALPPRFAVTLPKITISEQVRALADVLEPFGVTRMELMVETPQALLKLPQLIEESRGMAAALHFGAYDYTAALGITASRQDLRHPACDFARSTMQTLAAGSGLALSDGATNIMPVPVYRGEVTHQQSAENRGAVHRAWKLHYENIRHALDMGFYSGWDLHPAQLPPRYAAVYSFFLEGLDTAAERLRNFIAQAAQATLSGGVFDDAATGQGLLNYFVRAVNCGAIPEGDVPSLTGLSLEEVRSASFQKILDSRKEPA